MKKGIRGKLMTSKEHKSYKNLIEVAPRMLEMLKTLDSLSRLQLITIDKYTHENIQDLITRATTGVK